MHVANANDDNDDAVASDDNNAHTKYKQIKQQQTSSYISKEKKMARTLEECSRETENGRQTSDIVRVCAFWSG